MPVAPRLDLVHKAISARQIEWKDSCLKRFVDDPDMKSFTFAGINHDLRDFVESGGKLKERRETDPDWLREHSDDPWWYFAVLPVAEFKWGLFVKGKLIWEDGDSEDDAFFQIVSIHEQKKVVHPGLQWVEIR